MTAKQAAAAGPGSHSDGGGLILKVSPSGKRKWIFRFQLQGRRRDMQLGSGEDLTLAQARVKAAEARALVRQGIDPMDARAAEAPAVVTFTMAAAAFVRQHRRGWANPKHARQWVSTLKTYARPVIGLKPVDSIATEDLLAILAPIWRSKTETAKRLQGRIERVIDFATARGWRSGENPAVWRGHLATLLASPRKVKAAVHHPAMPWHQIPAFMAELKARDSISSRALQFLILTAARTGECLNAQWSEIDLDSATWTIPASRMKSKHEHRVPLSAPALEILQSLPRGDIWVFHGGRAGRPLSGMALLQLMRGLGFGVNGERGDYVPHGFRSSFRDWAAETTNYPREVCEQALAHVLENRVEAAYRRSDLFLRRQRLMADWSAFCVGRTASLAVLAEARQRAA